MKLLSHGFDTIRLVFSYKGGYEDYELQEIHSILYGLHQDKVNQNKTGNGNSVFSIPRNVTQYTVDSTVDKIKIYSRLKYSHITFSLARLVSLSNVEPLSLDNIDKALKAINSKLGIDCSKAIIERIDYNFNIGSCIRASEMWEYINPKTRHLTKNKVTKSDDSSNSSIYIENDIRKLCCYSQLYNKRYSQEDLEYLTYVKDAYKVNDIIRFEFRFFDNYLKYKSGGRLRQFQFSDLNNERFHNHLSKLIGKLTNDVKFINPESMTEADGIIMEFQNNPEVTTSEFKVQLVSKLMDRWSIGEIRDITSNINFRTDYHRKQSLDFIDEIVEFRSSHLGIGEMISDIPIIILNTLNDNGNDER